MQLDTYRSVEGSVSKHLVDTTTDMWLHRISWRVVAEMTRTWTNHDAGMVEDTKVSMRRGTELRDLRTATRNLSAEDTDIIATSPIFSDSLRKRSETSLLTSLSDPSPRAEQVLPAYTVGSQLRA